MLMLRTDRFVHDTVAENGNISILCNNNNVYEKNPEIMSLVSFFSVQYLS